MYSLHSLYALFGNLLRVFIKIFLNLKVVLVDFRNVLNLKLSNRGQLQYNNQLKVFLIIFMISFENKFEAGSHPGSDFYQSKPQSRGHTAWSSHQYFYLHY